MIAEFNFEKALAQTERFYARIARIQIASAIVAVMGFALAGYLLVSSL